MACAAFGAPHRLRGRRCVRVGDDEAWAYLEAVTEGQVPAQDRRAFLDGANRMVETFDRETGVRFEPVRGYPTTTVFSPVPNPVDGPLSRCRSTGTWR